MVSYMTLSVTDAILNELIKLAFALLTALAASIITSYVKKWMKK